MSRQKLKIWSNNYFTEKQTAEKDYLCECLAPYDFQLFDVRENGAAGVSREFLSQADIAFGQPDANALMNAENLNWVQINSAGYTPYDRDDLRESLKKRGAILTNSSAVFDDACAQHLLAMILSFARALPHAHDEQRNGKSWLMHVLRSQIRLLNGQTALILGFGAIGRKLSELLAPFKMNIIGVKRTVRRSDGETVKVIAETEVDEFLPSADHIIDILPANDSTLNFLNAERLSNLKPGAIIYNIGRGATIDQNALIKNLEKNHLGGAYLDVTHPEPLPPDNPLWKAPNCFITPHVAGGHVGEKRAQVQHFLDNLDRFKDGQDLINQINLTF